MTWTPLSRSKGQRSTLQGRGKLWRPPARLVNFTYFLQCLDSAVWMTEMSACCYLNIIIYHFLISLGLRGVFCTSAALSFAVIKVVLWSRGAHLTKPGWSKPHTHSNPTNLALFRRKISLYRFNQGGLILLQGGSSGSRGWAPRAPLTLSAGRLSCQTSTRLSNQSVVGLEQVDRFHASEWGFQIFQAKIHLFRYGFRPQLLVSFAFVHQL